MNVVIMPRLSLNEDCCLLSQWYVEEGARVNVGDKLFCIETDKSTMDVNSDFEGVLLRRYHEGDDVVDVLTPVCAIGEAGETPPDLEDAAAICAAPQNSASEEPAPQAPNVAQLPASPAAKAEAKDQFLTPRARRAAQENGLEPGTTLTASGAEGRVLEEDVLRAVAGKPAHGDAAQPGTASAAVTQPTPASEARPFSRVRKVIARNMLGSLQGSAQLTLTAVFNATKLQKLRAEYKRASDARKWVTINDLIVYGVAHTLTENREFNAWAEEDALRVFEDINIGVAVDTPRGLMVPTVFNADRLALPVLSAEIKRLAAECQEGCIAPEKLQNGTFTVSNLGASGILTFTPILNPPQVAILGVGKIDYAIDRTESGITAYPACHLSLTFDHRAVDGAPAARFLKRICENLENIDWLL